MKKALFLFLPALLAAATAIAQPTLTNNVFYQAGQTFTTIEGDTVGIAQGNAGANQTWNFSTLQPADSALADTYTIINAAGTPYAAQFPQANLAVTNVVDGETTYGYFQTSNTQINVLGVAATDFQQTYTNPQTVLQAPLNYNGSYSDTWAASFEVDGIVVIYNGSRTSTYDAYGTLVTPAGTFNNAMRVRTTETQRDSTNFGIGYSLTVSNTTSYDYYVANRPGALVTISYISGYNFLIFPGVPADTSFFDPFKSVSYQQSGSSAVHETPAQRWGLEIAGLSPNPTTDLLTVRFSAGVAKADLRLLITDGLGRTVGAQQLPAGNNAGLTQLPVNHLAPGAYTLTLTDGQQVQSVRFQKI